MTVPPLFRTAGETARLLGLTVKALRVFERHGLVQAQRTAVGWPVYGPKELLRLHQIIWLKRLGLKLTQIGAILHDQSVDPERLLALQEEVLLNRKHSIDQALRLVRKARPSDACESLSADELIALTKETAMTREVPDWVKKISPSVDRHLSEADKEELKTRFDGAAWRGIIAEAKSLLGTNPAAPAALALAGRWKEMTAALTGGNQDVKDKLRNIQQDAWAKPNTVQTFPVTPDVFEFVRTAIAKLEEQKH